MMKIRFAVKRISDIILSALALAVLMPIMLIAAVGIKLSSPGPVFYKARRMGKGMEPYSLYKFRTMHVGSDKSGSITAANDSRIFAFGALLRKLKIDELPQLVNILLGSMSIIGPRPEDVDIAEKYYSGWMKRTLDVLPGLASPGSVFNYTHGDMYLDSEDTEADYIEKLMPLKLAMDLYYVEHMSVWYDARIIIRTLYVIAAQIFGKKEFKYPKEYKYAEEMRSRYEYDKTGIGVDNNAYI